MSTDRSSGLGGIISATIGVALLIGLVNNSPRINAWLKDKGDAAIAWSRAKRAEVRAARGEAQDEHQKALIAGMRASEASQVAARAAAWRLDAFKWHMVRTETPYGRVLTETATATDGGVKYQTADGRRWTVTMELKAGGWHFGRPEEVKD